MYEDGKLNVQACLEYSQGIMEQLKACEGDTARTELTEGLIGEELWAYDKSDAEKAEYIQGVIKNFLDKGANLEVYSFRLAVIKAFNDNPKDSKILWSGKLFGELYSLMDNAQAIEAELTQNK